MGFFSWKTQDTDRSIMNCHSGEKMFTVYMRDDKGSSWRETNYEGYGIFGGRDYYDLLAEMNGFKGREEGIAIFFEQCEERKDIIFPRLTEDPVAVVPFVGVSPDSCPRQGYWGAEEIEEIKEDLWENRDAGVD